MTSYKYKKILLVLLSFIFFHGSSTAKGVVLSIQYGENKLMFDSVEMKTALSGIDFDIITYRVDKSRTIGEHTDRIEKIIGKYHDSEHQQPVFLLSDRMSSFVGLDVIAKDTTIVGLITFSGAFSNGDDFLYDNMSMKKNMAMTDSISFDHSKELYLKGVYKMIRAKKQGKKVKLTKNADESAWELRDLLNSQYGTSLVNFSLEERLSRIKSWIVPMLDDYGMLMMDVDLMNLSCIGNMYHLKYTIFMPFDEQNVVPEVTKQISETIKNKL